MAVRPAPGNAGGRAALCRAGNGAVRGVPASAGTYTGPVRVIRTETEFDRLRGGDVLVCSVTSPVWSVFFPLVGALVTDAGGTLSHPAIIAREFGVPAVIATDDGTSRLRDGQLVTGGRRAEMEQRVDDVVGPEARVIVFSDLHGLIDVW